jgi:hypothetical protein
MEIGKLYNHDPNHYRFKRCMDNYGGIEPEKRSRLVDCLLLILAFSCIIVVML